MAIINSLVGTYNYDELNRVTALAWTGAGENFSQEITYETNTDNIGQIQREATTGTFNYAYDKTDQLTSTSYTGPLSLSTSLVNQTFSYDYAGNRKEDSENGTTKTKRNIILENDNYTYFQDVEGLSRTTQISAKTENLHDLFNYRPDGKLERFRRFENNTQTRDVRYYYDALGRRIAKKLTINNSTWTNTFTHLADQSRILLAKDGNDNQTLYVDGLGIDEHLAKIDANTKTFVTDHLGTVINGEAVSEKGVTGVFGRNLGSDLTTDSSSSPVRYGFWGREHDSEKGTIFTPHRELDPRTGRWLTPDPISFDGGDVNLYRVTGNNPINRTDRLGLFTENFFEISGINRVPGLEQQFRREAKQAAIVAGAVASVPLATAVAGGVILGAMNVAPIIGALAITNPQTSIDLGVGFIQGFAEGLQGIKTTSAPASVADFAGNALGQQIGKYSADLCR